MNELGFKVFIILNIIMITIAGFGCFYYHSLFWTIYLIIILVNYYYKISKDPDFRQYL